MENRKRPNRKGHATTLTIPEDLVEPLNQLAAEARISRNAYIVQLIDAAVRSAAQGKTLDPTDA